MKSIFKKRLPWSHKGDFGRALIIAGSEIYTGAPYFNGMGAWRTGIDSVFLVGHPRAMNSATMAPELITHPLKGELKQSDVPYILGLADQSTAVLIGGGLPRTKSTHEILLKLIKKLDKVMVLDAEGIRALKGNLSYLKGKKILLTPHPDEFFALTGEKVENNIEDRIQKTKKWAKKLGVTILLKGHIDVISDGETVRLNKTGTPYMTKGGTGDVLAGLCVGFLAQGNSHLDSATHATYMNGKAGEKAYKRFGPGFRVEEMLEGL